MIGLSYKLFRTSSSPLIYQLDFKIFLTKYPHTSTNTPKKKKKILGMIY